MGQVRERSGSTRDESKHLPRYPTLLNGSTVFDARTGEYPSTEFSITTVNVPDRLDMQEVRAREDEDDRPRRRLYIDWYPFKVWTKRLIVMGVVGAIGYYGWQATQPLRDELQVDRIASRLSTALGQPVTVAAAEFKFQPSPRFVLNDVALGNQVKLNEVALHFNWQDAWRAVQGGGWVWGEATVAPLQLDLTKAQALLGSVAPLSQGIPTTISTVRFEEVQFPNAKLLPGKYQGLIRRDSSGVFGTAELTELGIEGAAKITVAAMPTESGAAGVEFSLDATRWRAPFGPQSPWNEARATGTWNGQVLEVLDYVLVGYYGSIRGVGYAASDVAWAVTGTARASNIHVESVFDSMRPPAQKAGDSETAKALMQGFAEAALTFGGHGEDLNAAIAKAVLAGPVEVRDARLNGINLGYVATNPGAQANGRGLTRFSEFAGNFQAQSGEVQLKNVVGKAGAMMTRGEVAMSPDMKLSGSLRVDLGAERVQAPINVRVRGSVLAPEFRP